MTVGLLVITHDDIGANLLSTATSMLSICPLGTEVFAVPLTADPDKVVAEARAAVERLDQGEGVLVLTDMFGSTPSNIAGRLHQDGRVLVVAGINLPMLIRVLNYPRLSLEELAHKALSGGVDGILMCNSNCEE